MRNSNCVIQFAKWPLLGNVKTRLAVHLGDTLARDVHIRLTEEVHGNLCCYEGADIEVHVDTVGTFNDEHSNGIFDTWANASSLLLQQGEDLGERMLKAIENGLRCYPKVLIVGSDCPSVDAEYLASAFSALESADMVVGPAEDGGYVLVGFSSIKSEVFDRVEWGSSEVLAQTLENAARINLSVARLDERWDVDEFADYVRWSNSRTNTD